MLTLTLMADTVAQLNYSAALARGCSQDETQQSFPIKSQMVSIFCSAGRLASTASLVSYSPFGLQKPS